jgi:hypothetical protein
VSFTLARSVNSIGDNGLKLMADLEYDGFVVLDMWHPERISARQGIRVIRRTECLGVVLELSVIP